jgi:hypothetical protein
VHVRVGPDVLHDLGCLVAPHQRASYDQTVKVLLPHDWLTFRLSRQVVTDRGMSGTGYWSREERWRPDVLTLIDADRDWGVPAARARDAGRRPAVCSRRWHRTADGGRARARSRA